jgi:hypothetical protein
MINHLYDGQYRNKEKNDSADNFYPKETRGGRPRVFEHTCSQGFEDAVSLSEDGCPGSGPFPWPLQTVLIRGAGTKENLLGQLCIPEEEREEVGFDS